MGQVAIWFFILSCIAATGGHLHAGPPRQVWYFTPEEIQAAYRYQKNFGKSVRHPLQARTCLYGAPQFNAWYYDRRVKLPCRFITESLRHLREILRRGAARYLFPLDLGHAHLAIPRASWESRYNRLPSVAILPAMLHDPDLLALYHSAEHLTIVDPLTGEIDRSAQKWQEKRNILGFYDGSPIEILPPHPDGRGLPVPKSHYGYGGYDLIASPSGRLSLMDRYDEVVLDFTLRIGAPVIDRLDADLDASRERKNAAGCGEMTE